MQPILAFMETLVVFYNSFCFSRDLERLRDQIVKCLYV